MEKLIYFSAISLFLCLIFGIYGHYKFEINNTESLPLGLYYINEDTNIKRNDIVVFCPTYNDFLKFAEKQGYWHNLTLACDNTTPKYMKKVVGIPNDDIIINLSGVYVNKNKIKHSEPNHQILSDKIFKNYSKHIILKNNEYFLMSDYNQLSYDSRYFGIVNKNNILYKVTPFIIYNK